MKTRTAAATAALAAVLTLSAVPAWASQPQFETLTGTLHFDQNGCSNGCQLTANGPFAGTAALEVLTDRANRTFSISHDLIRLSTSSNDSITVKTITRTTASDSTDPCNVTFQEQGTWQITGGAGIDADLQGGGTFQTQGVAVNHDPSCTGSAPYSNIAYQFTGQAHYQTP